jgi:UDP:flavonoid glycosyltransferase YjiC (YdhE family)
MRFLLTPVGSGGDVHPFVGIGRALQARGHEVILFGAEPHRKVVEQGGIEFVATVTTEQYHAATLDPDLWHPRLGVKTVLRMITPALESSFQSLREQYVAGRTMLVGHPLGFHTRTLEDLVGGPAASIQLAPSSIRTSHQMPALPPGIDLSWMPGWMKSAFWFLADRTVDPWILPALNRLRSTQGLPPVRRIFAGWINSPKLTLGLFPEWFGPQQPDWPASFRHASFPLWDDPAGDHIDAELAAFLDRGAPPVVVSPGTANRHASAFFSAATAALTRLGLRGLFLTGYPEQVPTELPGTIMVRRYAPFSEVLPRAAAFIHHGGIGTLAQGLASGKPQLIMPMAFDQPDNALRATRLGVARWLSPRKFTADRVTAALQELLENATVTAAAAEYRGRLRTVDGIQIACDLLEQRSQS